MINIYLKHAWRAFAHNRLYTLINIAGLVLSLAGSIIIARYVHQELTVDDYIPGLDRTMFTYQRNDTGHKYRTECKNRNNLKDYPSPQYSPEVEAFTQFQPYYDAIVEIGDDISDKFNILVTDSSFLDILPRKIVQGVRLGKFNEAMVTESTAKRLWPGKNALDETLKIYGDPNIYKIVGVLEDADSKRNFDYDMIVYADMDKLYIGKIGWMLCRLKPGVDYKQINSAIQPFEYTHVGGYLERAHPQFMPLKDIYFDTSFKGDTTEHFQIYGNLHNVRILEIVAALLLIVGLFNFLNIYSIVMNERRQTFGIRKSFGAGVPDIFCHIFVENFLIAMISVALAWLVVFVATPFLRDYVNMTLIPSVRFDIIITVSTCIVFPLAISIIAGCGIWRNSKVHSMGNSLPKGAIRVRRYLLLLPQMAVTLVLISVSVYFMRQVNYMLNADYGFQTNSIVSFRLWPTQDREASYNFANREELKKKREKEIAFVAQAMQAIKSIPSVESCALVYPDDIPSLIKYGSSEFKVRLKDAPNDEWMDFECVFIDKDVLETFNVKIEDIDTAQVRKSKFYYTLLNKEAFDKLAISDPASAVLETKDNLFWALGIDPEEVKKFNIAGKVPNLHTTSFTYQEYPLAIFVNNYFESENGKPLVRYKKENKAEVLAALTKIYQDMNGGDSVPEFEFVEDEIAKTYADDVRAAHVYIGFAVLAILISCLGLFGVVSYDLRRRRRELTIRRVLGAKKDDIVSLIIKPYLLVIAIASAIAVPVALYAIHSYRENYSNSLSVSPWIFIGAIAVITLISYVTVAANVSTLKDK